MLWSGNQHYLTMKRGIFYPSLRAFRNAWHSQGFSKYTKVPPQHLHVKGAMIKIFAYIALSPKGELVRGTYPILFPWILKSWYKYVCPMLL